MSKQFGEHATRTARKPHVCWWCGQGIDIGDRYVRWVWKDGELMTIKAHPECHTAWGSLEHGDEVCFADFARGCLCENGRCRCDKTITMSHDYPREFTAEEYREARGLESTSAARQRLNKMYAGKHVTRREVTGKRPVRSAVSQRPHEREATWYVWAYADGSPLQRENEL